MATGHGSAPALYMRCIHPLPVLQSWSKASTNFSKYCAQDLQLHVAAEVNDAVMYTCPFALVCQMQASLPFLEDLERSI